MSTSVETPKTRTSLPSRHPLRGDIQGLRAVAVLIVIGAHAGLSPLTGGFVGVDVFFVISGYLISRLLLPRSRSHRHDQPAPLLRPTSPTDPSGGDRGQPGHDGRRL